MNNLTKMMAILLVNTWVPIQKVRCEPVEMPLFFTNMTPLSNLSLPAMETDRDKSGQEGDDSFPGDYPFYPGSGSQYSLEWDIKNRSSALFPGLRTTPSYFMRGYDSFDLGPDHSGVPFGNSSNQTRFHWSILLNTNGWSYSGKNITHHLHNAIQQMRQWLYDFLPTSLRNRAFTNAVSVSENYNSLLEAPDIQTWGRSSGKSKRRSTRKEGESKDQTHLNPGPPFHSPAGGSAASSAPGGDPPPDDRKWVNPLPADKPDASEEEKSADSSVMGSSERKQQSQQPKKKPPAIVPPISKNQPLYSEVLKSSTSDSHSSRAPLENKRDQKTESTQKNTKPTAIIHPMDGKSSSVSNTGSPHISWWQDSWRTFSPSTLEAASQHFSWSEKDRELFARLVIKGELDPEFYKMTVPELGNALFIAAEKAGIHFRIRCQNHKAECKGCSLKSKTHPYDQKVTLEALHEALENLQELAMTQPANGEQIIREETGVNKWCMLSTSFEKFKKAEVYRILELSAQLGSLRAAYFLANRMISDFYESMKHVSFSEEKFIAEQQKNIYVAWNALVLSLWTNQLYKQGEPGTFFIEGPIPPFEKNLLDEIKRMEQLFKIEEKEIKNIIKKDKIKKEQEKTTTKAMESLDTTSREIFTERQESFITVEASTKTNHQQIKTQEEKIIQLIQKQLSPQDALRILSIEEQESLKPGNTVKTIHFHILMYASREELNALTQLIEIISASKEDETHTLTLLPLVRHYISHQRNIKINTAHKDESQQAIPPMVKIFRNKIKDMQLTTIDLPTLHMSTEVSVFQGFWLSLAIDHLPEALQSTQNIKLEEDSWLRSWIPAMEKILRFEQGLPSEPANTDESSLLQYLSWLYQPGRIKLSEFPDMTPHAQLVLAVQYLKNQDYENFGRVLINAIQSTANKLEISLPENIFSDLFINEIIQSWSTTLFWSQNDLIYLLQSLLITNLKVLPDFINAKMIIKHIQKLNPPPVLCDSCKKTYRDGQSVIKKKPIDEVNTASNLKAILHTLTNCEQCVRTYAPCFQNFIEGNPLINFKPREDVAPFSPLWPETLAEPEVFEGN